ncbi:hypothetical protein LguiA_026160 [Lonicera macranthoides]
MGWIHFASENSFDIGTFTKIYCCKQASLQHEHLREPLFCTNFYVDSTLTRSKSSGGSIILNLVGWWCCAHRDVH